MSKASFWISASLIGVLLLGGILWYSMQPNLEGENQKGSFLDQPLDSVVAHSSTSVEEAPLPVSAQAEIVREETQGVMQEEVNSTIQQHIRELVFLIQESDVEGLANLVEFPLDARSANAFGLDAPSREVKLSRSEFMANYPAFFTPLLQVELSADTAGYSIFNTGKTEGGAFFTLSVQTLGPWEGDPEISMECSHSIYCRVEDGVLQIEGFNLLCGGVA